MPIVIQPGIYKSRAKPGKTAIGIGFPTTTWYYFPTQPNDVKFNPSFPMEPRVNGTIQVPKFWDLEYTWDKALYRWWYRIYMLYDVQNQNIRLSYLAFGHGDPTNPKQTELGTDGLTLVNSAASGWVEAPAVWGEPPQAGTKSGRIVSGVSLKLNRVEWYIGGAIFNNAFPPGTDATGATTIHDTQTYYNQDLT